MESLNEKKPCNPSLNLAAWNFWTFKTPHLLYKFSSMESVNVKTSHPLFKFSGMESLNLKTSDPA